MRNVRKHALWGSALATACLWPTLGAAQAVDQAVPVQASDQPAAAAAQAEPEDTQEGGKVEDIVVTAQRRTESLQDVPISITAVTAETLSRTGVSDTQSLSMVTPGLQLTSVRSAVVPFLRGIGTVNITAGDEGATAIYVDGILNPVATANVFAFNNVERVEVLRGPQGTLFGRNAVGGLINVITADPSEEFRGQIEIGAANYSTIFGSAYVTGGLARGVAADLALYGNYQGDGWGRNFTLNRDQNRNREMAVRSKIRAEITSDLTATLTGDYSLSNSDIGSTRQPVPGALSIGGRRAVGTIFDSAGEVPPRGRKEQYGVSLRMNWDAAEDVSVQTISAYRNYRVDSNLDSDGTALKVFDVRDTTLVDTFQQELLVNGSTGRLEYTAGLFYFFSDAGYSPLIIRSNVIPTNNLLFRDNMETNSYAAFGQGTFSVTDSLRVTAGLRYTHDTRVIEGTITSQPGFPVPPGPGRVLASTDRLPRSQTDRSFEELTWRGVIDFDITDEVMIYGSVSRGFKSGVFSLTAPMSPAVEPETLDAYEAGFKADLFDRTLRFNLAAFYYEYSNIQVTTIGPTGTPVLLNAAAGEFKGLDGEIVYVVPVSRGNLELRGSFTLLDAVYTRYPGALFYTPLPTGGNRPSIGDASGNQATQAPEFTSSVTVDYSLPLSNGGTAGATATWSYNDGFFWDAQNRVREPSFHVINGELSYTSPDEAWRVRAFMRNILDDQRFIYVSVGANGDTGAPAAPRTYGVAISRRF